MLGVCALTGVTGYGAGRVLALFSDLLTARWRRVPYSNPVFIAGASNLTTAFEQVDKNCVFLDRIIFFV